MTRYAHETVLDLSYADESRARIVERSVAREVGAIDDERSATTVRRTGPKVSFTIRARDLTALRAATNTWLRLAAIAEDTISIADSGGTDAADTSTDHAADTSTDHDADTSTDDR